MSLLYRSLVRPVLFRQDAERAHARALRWLAWVSRQQTVRHVMRTALGTPELPVKVFGVRFPNPVGLAAGMDKGAEALRAWAALGFGFSEIGGVTWHAQEGNPKPRIFRAKGDGAIVNRMGLNNPGAEAMAERLASLRRNGYWPRHPVAVNLGKSMVTPLDQATEDYANSFCLLAPHVDFVVVNVSSPNTPNLRQLQDKQALDEIAAALQAVQDPRAPKPILVKVAPDLSFEALDEVLQVITNRRLAGIVATNTTIARPEAKREALRRVYSEEGGLSGKPLRERSTEVIRHLYQQTKGTLPIVGVGGIFNAADAWEKITAGASLVQIYTGLIYEGPRMVSGIVKGLRDRMMREGMKSLHEAVGMGRSSGRRRRRS